MCVVMQSMAMNALLGGKHGSSGSSNNQHGSNPLGSLAGQFLGGQHDGGSSGSHGSGDKPSSGVAGKIVGQLASNLLSPSNKPPPPQNYHGGQTFGQSSHHQGGLAGSVMGGVANMFGGKPGHGGDGVSPNVLVLLLNTVADDGACRVRTMAIPTPAPMEDTPARLRHISPPAHLAALVLLPELRSHITLRRRTSTSRRITPNHTTLLPRVALRMDTILLPKVNRRTGSLTDTTQTVPGRRHPV